IVRGSKRSDIKLMDFSDLTKVYDGLPNIDGVVGVSLADVPPKVRDIVGFRLMAENTRKHLRPCIYCAENTEAIHEMSDILLDGNEYEQNPIYSLGYSICSPLHWTDTAVKVFAFSAGHSIPVTINSEIMLGGSSPVTIAGGISLGNSEVLSGIVINQILESGRPVIYNLGFSHVLDMRTAAALSGAPECGLMAAAGADMAHYYKLPSAAWMSTDSLSTDSQSAFEHMLLLTAYLSSGINVIWGAGQIERQLSLSKEQAVIDDEIFSYAKRFARGFEVNPETLALDIIKKVGIGGEFLTEEHTLNHFKDELKMSEIAMRNRRETLSQPEDMYMEKRAENYADDILKQEKVCISDEQEREVQKVEKAWLKKYGY
ncbi:trimethylamine methyltransferase family protein, partial [candidate division KSB1 bacterium]